mmetsp:Transcript_12697/g.32427  ORF Transcript_12697/g.32427 Transcript_12697/m.32427 type:complete len:112 (-) Transcript_12697:289-624(-)
MPASYRPNLSRANATLRVYHRSMSCSRQSFVLNRQFNPGAMAKEFDDVVFGLYDTGSINPKNEAALYEPKYAVGEVHGPVQTKFGWHLINIETRYIADFDFRLKEEGVVEL